MGSFSICLSGQNKNIRKRYWEIFKESNWDKYHIADSIDNNLLIVDHALVEDADFDNRKRLTEHIAKESLKFITEIRDVLN